jgi:predicted PurR-regulated permease PerM
MFGISRAAGIVIGVLAIIALVALFGWLTVREVRSMVDQAAQTATESADAKWTAKIEKSNAEANARIADQAKAALQIEADANQRINAASQELEELRKRNAALPHGGDVGLTADRVRLLPD